MCIRDRHNRDRVVWRVKMLCDAHPELLTLKRGNLHFEIITARIHHRNMFTNFKAQSLHMVAILRIDPQKKDVYKRQAMSSAVRSFEMLSLFAIVPPFLLLALELG